MEFPEPQALPPISVSPLDLEAQDPVLVHSDRLDDNPYPQGVFDRNGVMPPYNCMAENHIKLTIEVLDAHLNILLTFSALFSAAISGLLSISWSLMSVDSSNQTNFLLQQLVHFADPSTQPAPAPLPVFSSSSDAIRVNTLISLSLTCSLLASFGAVLAKQWLVCFARNSRPFSYDQDQEYQKLLDGAKNWYLRPIVELALPMLLQASLVMFIMGLIDFVKISSPRIALVNYIVAIIGLSVFALSVLLAVWDPYCPYQTPLSRSMVPAFFKAIGFATAFTFGIIFVILVGVLSPVEMTARGIIQGFEDHSIRSIPGRLFKLWGNGFQSFKSNLHHLLYELPHVYGNMLQEILASWRRSPPDDAANYGSSAAWIFETAADIGLLRSVLSSVIEIKDSSFLRSFTKRGGWLEVQTALKGTRARLKATRAQPPRAPDAEIALFEMDAVILQDAILHLYVGTEEQTMPEIQNAWDALRAHLRRLEGYNPTTRNVEEYYHAGSHPASIAASIKILIHARSYRWTVGQIFLFLGDDLAEEFQAALRHCLAPVFPSTPPLGVSLIALAAGLIPCRREVAIGDVETDLIRQRKDDIELIRKSYTSRFLLLPNVARALKTYCSQPEGLSREGLLYSSESIHLSLLERTTALIITQECSSKDLRNNSISLVNEVGRLLLLNPASLTSSNVREVEMVQLEGTQLIAALLLRLQSDEGGHQSEANHTWAPVHFQTFTRCAAWLSYNDLLDEAKLSAFRSLEDHARALLPDPDATSFISQMETLNQSRDDLITPEV